MKTFIGQSMGFRVWGLGIGVLGLGFTTLIGQGSGSWGFQGLLDLQVGVLDLQGFTRFTGFY